MKTFYLNRKVDVSGISGTGKVAEGVEFDDGQCVLKWFGPLSNVEIAGSMDTLRQIHGHGGSTEVIYYKEQNDTRTV